MTKTSTVRPMSAELFASLKSESRVVFLEGFTSRIIRGKVKYDFGAKDAAYFVRSESLPGGWYYIVTFSTEALRWQCSCRSNFDCKHLLAIDAIMQATFKYRANTLAFAERLALIAKVEASLKKSEAARKRKDAEHKQEVEEERARMEAQREADKRQAAPLKREAFSLPAWPAMPALAITPERQEVWQASEVSSSYLDSHPLLEGYQDESASLNSIYSGVEF